MKKLLLMVLLAGYLSATVSTQTLSFQGKLLDNTGAVVTATKVMTFTLYPQATGGTAVTNALWSQAVVVQNGIYSAELDVSTVDLSNVSDSWMEVAVEGQTLSPRIHLTSSAFARRAVLADTAMTGNYAVTANNLQSTVFVNGNNVGIGTTSPAASLDVKGTINATDLKLTDPNSVGSMHLFDSGSVQSLWSGLSGEHVTSVSSYVPANAKGAILKVIVQSYATAGATFSTAGSSSIVFADKNGTYASCAHFYQNGITNYNQNWAGGMVVVPFLTGTKTFKWKMANNTNSLETDIGISSSYASLIGWY